MISESGGHLSSVDLTTHWHKMLAAHVSLTLDLHHVTLDNVMETTLSDSV